MVLLLISQNPLFKHCMTVSRHMEPSQPNECLAGETLNYLPSMFGKNVNCQCRGKLESISRSQKLLNAFVESADSTG